MARGFRAGGAGGFGGGITSVTIPFLKNNIGGANQNAGNRTYEATLKMSTSDFTSLKVSSLTGNDYGGSGLTNTTLSISGDISGSLYSATGSFSVAKTFDITNDDFVTINIRSQYYAQNGIYTQTLSDIVFEK